MAYSKPAKQKFFLKEISMLSEIFTNFSKKVV
jgi:hypothetical protein